MTQDKGSRTDIVVLGTQEAVRGALYAGRRCGLAVTALNAMAEDGAAIWSITRTADTSGFRLDMATEMGPVIIEASRLILAPSAEDGSRAARLLRAAEWFDATLGWWRVVVDEVGRTSVPGLYIAGNGEDAGALTAFAAAQDGGTIPPADELAALQQLLAKSRPADVAATHPAGLLAAPLAALPPEAVICGCEAVTRGEIDLAAQQGAYDLNQLKSWTRCGMGACQGRDCEAVAAALLAAAKGCGMAEVGRFTARLPLTPLTIDRLAGACDYGDIRLPPAAPI